MVEGVSMRANTPISLSGSAKIEMIWFRVSAMSGKHRIVACFLDLIWPRSNVGQAT